MCAVNAPADWKDGEVKWLYNSRDSLFQVAEENNFSEKDVFSVSTGKLLFRGYCSSSVLLILVLLGSLYFIPSALVSWGTTQHQLLPSGHLQNGTNSALDIGV